MSCRESSYSSAMFTLARYSVPLDENHVQEEYHALRRQAQHDGEEIPAPTEQEVQEALDRSLLWVRHHPMPPRQRASLVERLEDAQKSPLPDGTTWYATRRLSQRLIAMTDPLYCQSRLDSLSHASRETSNLMETLRDKQVSSSPVDVSERATTKERVAQIDDAVESARKDIASAARVLGSEKPIKKMSQDSTLLRCDALADEIEDFNDFFKQQRNTLYAGYDAREPEALRKVYYVNRYLASARRALSEINGVTPE